MSHFICEHCGAHIVDSPKGYLSGCEHYPMEKQDECVGCIYDTDENACSNPLFYTVEFWVPSAPKCFTPKPKED